MGAEGSKTSVSASREAWRIGTFYPPEGSRPSPPQRHDGRHLSPTRRYDLNANRLDEHAAYTLAGYITHPEETVNA